MCLLNNIYVPQVVNCICLRFDSTTEKGVNKGNPYKIIEIIEVNRRDLKEVVNTAKCNFNNEDGDKINLKNKLLTDNCIELRHISYSNVCTSLAFCKMTFFLISIY